MTFVWAVIGVLLAIVWVITIVDIVGRGYSFGRVAAWLLIVVLLPFVGSILYWVLRQPSAEEAAQQAAAQADLRHSTAKAPVSRGRLDA